MAEVEVKLVGWKEEKDKVVVVVDAWSFLHALCGAAMKNVGVGWNTAFWLHAGYELNDMYDREKGEREKFNSSLNSAGDQAFAMLGHYLGPKDTTGYYPWVWIFAGAAVVYNHYGFVGDSA